MPFRDFLKDRLVILDGGTGTLLQAAGLPAGTPTEAWNVGNPDAVTAIHRAYFDAGSTLVATNTFGVNGLKYAEDEIARLVTAAVGCARRAAKESAARGEKFVALDVGPLGRLLSPLGDLDFEDAVRAFAPVVRAGAAAGVDAVLIETMSDLYETKAAVLAAKENADLPVLVSNAYGTDGRLMTGATPAVVVATLEGLGVDAVGVNCSQGPRELAPIVREYLRLSSLPVLCKPNAGLPRVDGDGNTVFDVSPAEFATLVAALVGEGVRIYGGCCGTTPAHIAALAKKTKTLSPMPIVTKNATVVSSGTVTVDFENTPVLIGERINPTGKKRFREALAANDMTYILSEGIRQTERGAQILDVNVGAPGIDEKEMLVRVAGELAAVTDLPLCLDTSDPVAMEKALRRYNGKPLVNSVNGKRESMEKIFPLVKKYGGVLVALTLDEDGIPATVAGRVAVAEKILTEAKKYGLSEKDLVFDPLTLTVSADGDAANVTLGAVKIIREELGCHTSLGVSNVSFGLPARAGLNATFFTVALENGLSAAIVNPDSPEMMNAYHSYRALRGIDRNCLDYIRFADGVAPSSPTPAGTPRTLADAVEKGLGAEAAARAKELLETKAPLEIVNGEIIPALDRVGAAYEEKRAFLPQLLLSAEAASAAFGVIKAALPAASATRYPIVLATVKGDIHDIGKNIVKLILENYGFAVLDLGRDVPPERVVDEAIRLGAPLVGLSALMTTTVPAMEETVRLLHARAPFCKVIVGGAVLTREYAEKIGADAYAKDAMETVRFAESLLQ